jgi:hypothetical protein
VTADSRFDEKSANIEVTYPPVLGPDKRACSRQRLLGADCRPLGEWPETAAGGIRRPFLLRNPLRITKGPASAQSQSISNEMLQSHNAVRQGLGLPTLAWSDRLAARAQDRAASLLAKNQFLHSPKSPYGENLFEMTGGRATPAHVVRAWASESRNYDLRIQSL